MCLWYLAGPMRHYSELPFAFLKNLAGWPKSKPDSPSWYMVDIRAVKKLPRFITLDELRKVKGLEKMVLLQRGSRLSIQPVRPEEWEIINSMA